MERVPRAAHLNSIRLKFWVGVFQCVALTAASHLRKKSKTTPGPSLSGGELCKAHHLITKSSCGGVAYHKRNNLSSQAP